MGPHGAMITGAALDLSAIILLAALIRINALMRAAGRHIIGKTEAWGGHSCEIHYHLLYARIWIKRGSHSTAVLD